MNFEKTIPADRQTDQACRRAELLPVTRREHQAEDDRAVIVPAPGLAAWRLVIDPGVAAASLQCHYHDDWLPVWPDVPVPGRLLVMQSAGRRPGITRRYELTWHGLRYLPRRHHIRHVLWLIPAPLPSANAVDGRALVRCLAAACERRPVNCLADLIPEPGLP